MADGDEIGRQCDKASDDYLRLPPEGQHGWEGLWAMRTTGWPAMACLRRSIDLGEHCILLCFAKTHPAPPKALVSQPLRVRLARLKTRLTKGRSADVNYFIHSG
jgi:hypothetical protein